MSLPRKERSNLDGPPIMGETKKERSLLAHCFALIFQERGTQRERSAPDAHKESDESARTDLTSILSNTQQPAVSTMDEYDSYLDSLAGGRLVPLRGNPPDDSNQNHDEQRRGGAMIFAATPPDYNGNRSYRTRSSVRTGDRSDTPSRVLVFVITTSARMPTLARSIG